MNNVKILVIGGGGREHAIIKKLLLSDRVEKIYAAPGNGGIARDAECVPLKVNDIDGLVSFAKENGIGFVVIAPEDPLVRGAADAFKKAGIPAFAPSAEAAMLEGSKLFAKAFMKRHNIPTAAYESFDDSGAATEYLRGASYRRSSRRTALPSERGSS